MIAALESERGRTHIGHIVFLGMLVAVFAGLLHRRLVSDIQEVWHPAPASPGVPETMLVFIGSSTCGGSNYPGLEKAIRRLRKGLRDEASARGETFSSMGIATDFPVQPGVEYLKRLGPFDEIMAGRSWLNTGSLKYLYGADLGGRVAIPQILIVRRVLVEGTGGVIEVSSEKTLFRKSGGEEIVRWVSLAYPEP